MSDLLNEALDQEMKDMGIDNSKPFGSALELVISDYDKSFDKKAINELATEILEITNDVELSEKVNNLYETYNEFKKLSNAEVGFYKETIIDLNEKQQNLIKSNVLLFNRINENSVKNDKKQKPYSESEIASDKDEGFLNDLCKRHKRDIE